jgi:hypothetical protein
MRKVLDAIGQLIETFYLFVAGVKRKFSEHHLQLPTWR